MGNFKEMTATELSHIGDALEDMEIKHFIDYSARVIMIDGETFTNQEEMDDHIIIELNR